MSGSSLFFRCGMSWTVPIIAAACIITMAPASQATPLVGTVLTSPGATVFPTLTSAAPGTLLASLVAPYSFATTAGTTSGTLTSAVYRNSSGTLDFYYQVMNSSGSATDIAREIDTSFAGVTTWTGYRTDAVGPFVAGTVAPVTADRNVAGSVVGFNFNPPESAEILHGTTSDILVISTNSLLFTAGNASVIDGGTSTVASFAAVPTSGVPEPTTTLLIGGGLAAVAILRRWKRQ